VSQSGGICKPTKPTIAQINRRVALAHERAQKAVALADTTALNENAQLVRAGVKRTALVSVRMSSKGFGDRDPRHALKILRLLSVDAMEAYTFAMLGLTSYKYHVSIWTAGQPLQLYLRPRVQLSRQTSSFGNLPQLDFQVQSQLDGHPAHVK
jgi:hypothetical protein